MPTPAETILTNIGLPAEDVSKVLSVPEAEADKFDPKPFVDKVRESYQTQFKNDPNFYSDITIENLPPAIKKQMESAQYARATNVSKEKIAKALGFTDEQIKDLAGDDYKALDYFVPAIVDKWTKTKASDPKLQQDLIEARKKLEGYEGYEEKVKGKYETEANQKITAAIFNAALIGELSAIPNLKVKASTLAREANEILNSKYSFERVGDFAVELRQKANPQMKVLKEGSSKELTLREALTEIAETEGWIEKGEKGKEKQTGSITITPENGSLKMVSPHIADKISKKIAAEK